MRPLSKKKAAEILRRVASHIKRWPHLYSYGAGTIPTKPGQQACVLARAGKLMRMRPDTPLPAIAERLGFGGREYWDAESAFYNAVCDSSNGSIWMLRAGVSEAVRKLADTLYPRKAS